jgi:hypothetical protein
MRSRKIRSQIPATVPFNEKKKKRDSFRSRFAGEDELKGRKEGRKEGRKTI